MKKVLKEMKTFLECKIYVVFLALVTAGAYGYAITHYAIGMDDTAVALYYDEGLAPYVGRWSLFVLNKIISIADFVPWFVELASVVVLMISVTLWCALWKQICEPKVQLPVWSYVFPAAIFISCPLISEVFVFYLHNGICIGYGMTALAVWWLVNSLNGKTLKEGGRHLLVASVLLTFALGFYESFALVYVLGAISCFFLLRSLYGKDANPEITTKIGLWIRNGLISFAISFLLRGIILVILKLVYQLEKFGIYNVSYRNLFGEIFLVEGELGMILKKFYALYYVNSLVYLPITILLCALVFLGIYAIYKGKIQKDFMLLICVAAIVLLPIAMAVIEGMPTRYRTAQYVPMICAFGVMILLVELYSKKCAKWLMACAYVVLSIIIYNQCADMTKWFYIDDLKYQDAKTVMSQIAYDLKRDYNVKKPIVFKGAYAAPNSICEEAYVSFQSWQFKAISALSDPIDPTLKEKYFS